MEQLSRCAAVAGSILGEATVIFRWPNLPGRNMALESAQRLREMSSRDILWKVKADDT